VNNSTPFHVQDFVLPIVLLQVARTTNFKMGGAEAYQIPIELGH